MLIDLLTKSLQGTMFYVFRNIIMGHANTENIRNIKSFLIKERVGRMIKPEKENNNAWVQKIPQANIKPDPRNNSEPRPRSNHWKRRKSNDEGSNLCIL